MYLEKAKIILDASALGHSDRDLWASVLVHHGEPAAEKFVTDIGDDAELLLLATRFLRARFSSDEEPAQGVMGKAEQKVLFDVLAEKKAEEKTHNNYA